MVSDESRLIVSEPLRDLAGRLERGPGVELRDRAARPGRAAPVHAQGADEADRSSRGGLEAPETSSHFTGVSDVAGHVCDGGMAELQVARCVDEPGDQREIEKQWRGAARGDCPDEAKASPRCPARRALRSRRRARRVACQLRQDFVQRCEVAPLVPSAVRG